MIAEKKYQIRFTKQELVATRDLVRAEAKKEGKDQDMWLRKWYQLDAILRREGEK